MQKTCCGKKEPQAPAFYEKLVLYKPLIVIVLISILSATALAGAGHVPFMNALMGFFLIFLAALKLFNLQGFAKSFSKYDIVARRSPAYGMAYPFIELGLASLYLSGLWPLLTNGLMIFFMAVGTVGVVQTIKSGQLLQCACVGTAFNLPVGRVTLLENLAMALMAAMNIAHIMGG